MSVGDQMKGILDKALEFHREVATMTANFQNLERQFERLVQNQEKVLEKIQTEHEELRLRVLTLEGIVNSTLTESMKEALTRAAREHLAATGELPKADALARALLPKTDKD